MLYTERKQQHFCKAEHYITMTHLEYIATGTQLLKINAALKVLPSVAMDCELCRDTITFKKKKGSAICSHL